LSDCIRFKGHIRKQDGYGIVGRSRNGHKRIFLAHRWVWALHHGKDPWQVPKWIQVSQSCGDHACVNPEHLTTEVGDAVIDTLPNVVNLKDIRADVLLTAVAVRQVSPTSSQYKTKAAMSHALRTECAQGHAFREAPDDTPCLACQIDKKLDLDSEVQPA